MLRAACSKLRLALSRARVSLVGQPLLRRSAAPYHAHRDRRILPFRPPNRSRQYPNRRLPSASTVFIFLKPRPTAAGAPRRSLALLRSGLIRFAEPALIFGIDANIMSFGAGWRRSPIGPLPVWAMPARFSRQAVGGTGLDSRDRARWLSHPGAPPRVQHPTSHTKRPSLGGTVRAGRGRRSGATGKVLLRARVRAWLRGHLSKRLGSPHRVGRPAHWLKIKNPAVPAVRRLEEEDWS